jgi:GT2 family glycosyltransferase
MTDRPLVSVITGTWQRHELLLELIENIRQQTYRPLEHVIVSDGPDPDLEDLIRWNQHTTAPIRFVECGRHWTGELSDSYASAPFAVGQMLARGDYACLWADDERALTPDHITKMVNLIESEGVDFVFPTVEFYWHHRPRERMYIGANPPQLGSITHWLYRSSMIEKARGPYRTHVGRANDWEFIHRAIMGGATWAWLQEVTFSHRADD